jgi:hypothetical protein
LPVVPCHTASLNPIGAEFPAKSGALSTPADHPTTRTQGRWLAAGAMTHENRMEAGSRIQQ